MRSTSTCPSTWFVSSAESAAMPVGTPVVGVAPTGWQSSHFGFDGWPAAVVGGAPWQEVQALNALPGSVQTGGVAPVVPPQRFCAFDVSPVLAPPLKSETVAVALPWQ